MWRVPRHGSNRLKRVPLKKAHARYNNRFAVIILYFYSVCNIRVACEIITMYKFIR